MLKQCRRPISPSLTTFVLRLQIYAFLYLFAYCFTKYYTQLERSSSFFILHSQSAVIMFTHSLLRVTGYGS